ncbi:hypothetical protein [Sphingopyxis granuli]|uniref:hypothetical protein n=1 Tax=Sphingopyxis granuli TaxID=267128 RepID=UPI001BB03AA6|nr:hypothetical protein [Sphingopyxis granuli]QUM73332.1 hypothetical protein ICN83_05450 [Sphingopyxis granuli]
MTVFALAGAAGVFHGLGKSGLISSYGYFPDRMAPPIRLVMALVIGAGFASMAAESDRGMLLAGLGSVGAFTLGHYATSAVAYVVRG